MDTVSKLCGEYKTYGRWRTDGKRQNKMYGEMATNNKSKIGDMSRIDSGCESYMDGECGVLGIGMQSKIREMQEEGVEEGAR